MKSDPRLIQSESKVSRSSARVRSFREDVEAQLRAQGRPPVVSAYGGGGVMENSTAATTRSKQIPSVIGVLNSSSDHGKSYQNQMIQSSSSGLSGLIVNHGDPDEVAQSILNIRERRENQSRSRRQQQQQQHQQQHQRQQQQQRSQSTLSRHIRHNDDQLLKEKLHVQRNSSGLPSGRCQSTSRVLNSVQPSSFPLSSQPITQNSKVPNKVSQVGQEKISKRLDNTEHKINGLMQELDDLKFFEELDQAEPAPCPMRSQSAPRTRPQSPPPVYYNETIKSPPTTGNKIPTTIRAASSGMLPPPPPISTPALQDDAPLPSPRKISKLDRLALELETQTLCRKVDMLRREKQVLLGDLQVLEESRRDQDHNVEKIYQLETALRDLSVALKQAKDDLHDVREQTVKDYEKRLNENIGKLQSTQAEVDTVRGARDAALEQVAKYKKEIEDVKSKLGADHQAKEIVFETQLQEITELAEELQKEVQEKEDELLDIQQTMQRSLASKDSEFMQMSRDLRRQIANREEQLQNLTKAANEKEKVLTSQAKGHDHELKAQVATFQEQLRFERVMLEKVQNENLLLQDKYNEQLTQLMHQKNALSDHRSLNKELSERMEVLQSEYKQKFKELKKAFEENDKRRLEELENAKQNEMFEFEQRMNVAQEQLLQTRERYHTDLQIKSDEIMKLEEQLRTSERQRLSVQEDKDRLEKENAKLKDLSETHNETINEIKSKHAIEIQTIKDQGIDESKKLVSESYQLQTDLASVKATMQKEIDELNNELEQTRESKTKAIAETQSHLEDLKSSYEKTKDDLSKEKIRNEMVVQLQAMYDQAKSDLRDDKKRHDRLESQMRVEIALLEGNARVHQSTMQERCERITELEESLRRQASDYGSSLEESKHAIQKLEKEVNQTNELLKSARNDVRQKEDAVKRLEETCKDLSKKDSVISELEKSLQEYKDYMNSSEHKRDELKKRLEQTEHALVTEKELRSTIESQLSVEIAMLEGKIRSSSSRIQHSRNEYEDMLDSLRSELDSLRSEMQRITVELEGTKKDLAEKSYQLEERETKVANLEKAKDQVTEEMEDTMAQLLHIEGTLNERIVSLERQTEESKIAVETGKLREQLLEKDLKHLEESLASLEVAKAAWQETQLENGKLRTDLEDIQTKLQDSRNMLEEETELSISHKAEIERYEIVLDERACRIQELEDSLSLETEKARTRIAELENEFKIVAEKESTDSNAKQRTERLMKADVAALRSKLSGTEATLRQKVAEIETLTQTLQVCKDKECANRVESSTRSQEMHSELETLREELKLCHEDLEKARSELTEKTTRLEELQTSTKQSRQLELEIADLKENLLAATVRVEELEGELALAKESTGDQNSKLPVQVSDSNFNEDKFDTDGPQSKARGIVDDDNSDIIKSLEGKLDESLANERNLRDLLKSLQAELEESELKPRAAATESREKMYRLDGRLLASESLLAVKQDTINQLEAKLQDVLTLSSDSSNDLQRNLEDTRQKLVYTTEELTKASCEGKALEKLLTTLQEQYKEETDKKNEKIKQLETQMLEAKRKESKLSECVEKLDSTYQKAQNQLVSDKEFLESTEVHLRQEMSVLEKKLRTSETNLNQTRSELSHIESKLAKVSREASSSSKSLEDEISNLNTRMMRKNEEVKDLESRIVQFQEEATETARVISCLETEVAREKEKNENVEVTLKVQISMLEGRVRASDASLKEKRSAVQKLENELAVSVEKIASLSQLMQDEQQKSAKRIENLQVQLHETESQLKDTIAKYQGETLKLKESLHNKHEGIIKLEESISKSLEEAKSYKSRQLQAEDALLQSTQQGTRYKMEIKELQSKLQDLARQLENEQKDCNLCHTKLDQVEKQLQLTEVEASKATEMEADLLLVTNQAEASQREVKELSKQLDVLQDQKKDVMSKLLLLEQDVAAKELTRSQLEQTLLTEQEDKRTLIESLSSMRFDLELKEQQLERIPKLQNQLKSITSGREELQDQLGRVESELQRKEKQITQLTDELTSLRQEYDSRMMENRTISEQMKTQLREVEEELEKKTDRYSRQIQSLESDLATQSKAANEIKVKLRQAETDLSSKQSKIESIADEISMETQSKIEALMRAKARLESSVRELQEDKEDREKQIKESSEKFSNKILELQMKTEELTAAKTSLQMRLSRTETELEGKEERLRDVCRKHTIDSTEMNEKLMNYQTETEKLKKTLGSVEAQLSTHLDSSKKDIEVQTAELQKQLEAESKEKRSLVAKLTDIEGEVMRKEKQIKDIVDRYSVEIAELENRLDTESRTRSSMHSHMNSLKSCDLVSISDQGSESSELQYRILTLEKTINAERLISREAELKMKDVQSQLEELILKNTNLQNQLDRFNGTSIRSFESSSESSKLMERISSLQSTAENERKRAHDADLAKRFAEDKLSAQQQTIIALKQEIEYLRDRSIDVSPDATGSWELRAKVLSLEKSLDTEKSLARDAEVCRSQLEQKLLEASTTKISLEQEIKKRVELETTLAEKENIIESLAVQLLDQKDKNSVVMKEESSTLKERIVELERLCHDERQKLQENLKATIDLESKLSKVTFEKERLLQEVDYLRKSSTESSAFLQKVTSKEVDRMKHTSENSIQDLENKLAVAEKIRKELEKSLEKANADRAEVINALEEVIYEVQNREDEIEALSKMLLKRDEELEHAKLIATKAVATSQDIKTRYKTKGIERESDLNERINQLTKVNQSLETKSLHLEKELKGVKGECENMKNEIRKKSLLLEESQNVNDTVALRGFSTESDCFATSFTKSESESPTCKSSYSDEMHDETMSIQSNDIQHHSEWIAESTSTDTEDNPSTSMVQNALSRRTQERDALRKYVRKRYLKSKGSS